MRGIFISFLLLSSVYAGEHTVLASLFSKHIENKDMHGDEFNEENYGLGYQYSTFKGSDEVYMTLTTMVLKDSYKNNMYTATAGLNKPILEFNKLRLSLGAEVGVAYKAIKSSNKKEVDLLAASGVTLKKKVNYAYSVIPILLIPKITVSYAQFSVNVLYIPEAEVQSKHSDAVLWATIGYTF